MFNSFGFNTANYNSSLQTIHAMVATFPTTVIPMLIDSLETTLRIDSQSSPLSDDNQKIILR